MFQNEYNSEIGQNGEDHNSKQLHHYNSPYGSNKNPSKEDFQPNILNRQDSSDCAHDICQYCPSCPINTCKKSCREHCLACKQKCLSKLLNIVKFFGEGLAAAAGGALRKYGGCEVAP